LRPVPLKKPAVLAAPVLAYKEVPVPCLSNVYKVASIEAW